MIGKFTLSEKAIFSILQNHVSHQFYFINSRSCLIYIISANSHDITLKLSVFSLKIMIDGEIAIHNGEKWNNIHAQYNFYLQCFWHVSVQKRQDSSWFWWCPQLPDIWQNFFSLVPSTYSINIYYQSIIHIIFLKFSSFWLDLYICWLGRNLHGYCEWWRLWCTKWATWWNRQLWKLLCWNHIYCYVSCL